ncbi:hypothetical protein OOK28_36375 [Streptomyces sp. NBC_00687]|nr:hypothetical protein [Streptomyces sp. NBC_00687]
MASAPWPLAPPTPSSPARCAPCPTPTRTAPGASSCPSTAQFRTVFPADLPTAQTRLLAAEQRPVDAAAFSATTTAAAWRTIPTWALIARQDRALGADLERFEGQRASAHTVEINNSHAAMISHPAAVPGLVLSAARSTDY